MNIYLTPDQVCRKLQIAKPTLYQFTRLKLISCAKVGRWLRFEENILDQWFRKRSNASEGKIKPLKRGKSS